MAKKTKKKPAKSNKNRQPIVAILGHVDHGKTTLLDYIRKTHVQSGEAGGITQSIGAYQAEFQGKKITFIDTPGHAAFSKMRSRGADSADIAILVVAADDGVKPQTIESIKHLKKAKIPFIVAINKIDKEGAIPDNTKAELTKHEVFVEGYGGNTPVVEISAKKGTNIDALLENILILAELEELEFAPNKGFKATIIEARKDPKKGILVNTIITSGTIVIQQELRTESSKAKVKALYSDTFQPLTQTQPGQPLQILGFKQLPKVGELITTKQQASKKAITAPAKSDLLVPDQLKAADKLNIILKTDTLGSLEAIKGSISDEINLILEETGNISDSDIFLATTTGSLIVGFNVKAPNSVKKLADSENVSLKTYRVIYELLDILEKKVLKMLDDTIDEEILGVANILKIFKINKSKIAGCQITSGTITVGDTIHLTREQVIIKDSRIKSLKIGKDKVKKVTENTECGILLSSQLDIKENDSIISYNKKQEED